MEESTYFGSNLKTIGRVHGADWIISFTFYLQKFKFVWHQFDIFCMWLLVAKRFPLIRCRGLGPHETEIALRIWTAMNRSLRSLLELIGDKVMYPMWSNDTKVSLFLSLCLSRGTWRRWELCEVVVVATFGKKKRKQRTLTDPLQLQYGLSTNLSYRS